MERNNIICPVTFVNNKLNDNPNLNGFFINPYATNIQMDFCHADLLDDIKDFNADNFDSESYLRFATKLKHTETRAAYDSIMAYMVMNISDLVRNILISFIQNALLPNDKANAAKILDNKSNTIADYLSGYFTDEFVTFDIEREVSGAIAEVNIADYHSIYDTEKDYQQIYLLVDSKMSSLYSMLVANIFEKFIVTHVFNALKLGGLSVLYKILHLKCYGDEPKTHPNAQTEYAFCCGIMREIMDEELVNFRSGLIMISKTVSEMIYNAPMIGHNACNLDYSVKTLVQNEVVREMLDFNGSCKSDEDV